MCQDNHKFIFCTCSADEMADKKDELTEYYTWTLTKYIGTKETRIRGKIAKPKNDLGNGITLENTLEQLNNELNNFDFDYTPSERDSLRISIPHPIERIQRFTVIYINEKWQSGANNIFTSITETMASGRIKRQANENTNDSKEDDWITLTKDTADAIYEKLYVNTSIKAHWDYITELVDRNPEECFKKGQVLILSNSLKEKIIGANLFVKLYYSGYDSKKILLLFFDLLKSEQEERILSPILAALNNKDVNFSEEQIDFLCSFTERGDTIKTSLMDAFCEFENDKAIDAFIQLSKDKNPEIRQTAVFNLGSLLKTDNPKIRKALWASFLDKDPEVKFDALLGLANRKDGKVKDVLIEELKNFPKDDGIRFLLLDSVEELADKSLIPHLEALLVNETDLTAYLKEVITEIINDIK